MANRANEGKRYQLKGLPAAEGVAVGPAWWYERPSVEVGREQARDPTEERERLQRALAAARADLEDLIKRRKGHLPDEELAIFEAQRLMLDDPDLLARAEEGIAQGYTAAWAWQEATAQVANALAALPDPYFQARAADVRDIAHRVLEHLLGIQRTSALPSHPIVMLAEDLMPSDTVDLDPARVLAFCTVGGGPTSHAAILARRLGIPAVVGVGERLREVASGTMVLVDGDTGTVVVAPTPEEEEAARQRWEQRAGRRRQAEAHAREPAITLDGERVEVAANVATPDDALEAARLGAEAIGLLRTEFLFLERTTPPSEEEQVRAYRAIFEAMQGRPVVVRTLDVGGDKPLPYIPHPPEMNPFLGVRAIRLAREHPEMLRTQLRAILRAGAGFPTRVMFPMVATVEEMRWLRDMFDDVLAELRAEGHQVPSDVQVGMMVEIPSAALLAESFCPYVDFFSIGTNDLSQYTLAADRSNARVAALADGLHPAVLRLVDMVVRAAHAHGRWVGVCGETAGERAAVPILIGLGVDELSVAPKRVPEVKALVRQWRMADAREVARVALKQTSADQVRALIRL